MNIEPSGNNLNVNEIFAKLDAMDGGGADGKIEASIWNTFADVAGGKHIKNFINKDNAIKSISAYIARASEDVKNKISDFLKNSNASSTNNTSATDTSSTANTIETLDAGTFRSRLIDFWREEEAPAIKQAKEEQPKLEEKIGAKASNGMSYKEAQGIMRRIYSLFGSGVAVTKTSESFLEIPSHDKIEWLGKVLSSLASEKERAKELYELFSEAKSAIYELEKNNPDILQSYKKYSDNKDKYGSEIYTKETWKNEVEQMKRWDRLTGVDTTSQIRTDD